MNAQIYYAQLETNSHNSFPEYKIVRNAIGQLTVLDLMNADLKNQYAKLETAEIKCQNIQIKILKECISIVDSCPL